MTFRKLNADSARAADNRQSGISAAGKYLGKLVKAEFSENKTKGSQGINFGFVSANGEEANVHVNLKYFKDGQVQDNEGGFQLLDSLMVCLRVKELDNPIPMKVEKWNNGQKEQVDGFQFAQLLNKPVGVVFRMEEYYNDKGELKHRPLLVTWFDHDSEKVASEVLDKSEAKSLERTMAWVAANPVKATKQKPSNANVPPPTTRERYEQAISGGQPSYLSDDLDDSIPF